MDSSERPCRNHSDGEVVLTQTANTLTLEGVDAADGRISMIFNLDGTESLNIMASVEIKSRASWEGDKLIIGHRNGPRTFETVIWFDTNRFLVIENDPTVKGSSTRGDSSVLRNRPTWQARGGAGCCGSLLKVLSGDYGRTRGSFYGCAGYADETVQDAALTPDWNSAECGLGTASK